MRLNDFNFKKKYGQNFLKDDSVPNKIIEHSDILDNSLVIEIGPGAGILTKKIALKAKRVLAYEIDLSLKDTLNDVLSDYDNVRIVFDDFLNRNIKNDILGYEYDHLYVIANLPYYITTPIIMKFIEEDIDIKRLVVMVQKEVGERFAAKPKTKNYGSITVYLNYYFDIHKLFDVSRNCFIPKPNVDSVIMALDNKENKFSLLNKDLFFKLVRDSFQFKRKTLRNNLKGYNLEIIEGILEKYGYNLTTRAEELPLEVFIDISNNLCS